MLAPEEYMIPCFWKKTLNIECMGCGIQRAMSLLFQGEFIAAFKMYPAIYTLIILAIFLVVHIKYQFKLGSKILLALFILNVSIIIISYILKFT